MDILLRFKILERTMGFGLKKLKYGPLLAVAAVFLALVACGGSEPASQPGTESGGSPGGSSPGGNSPDGSARTALIAVEGNLIFPKRPAGTDCANLHESNIDDAGWMDYPRPKTEI